MKKFLAMFMAVVMLVGAFGCGASSENEPATSAGETTSVSAETSANESAEAVNFNADDYKLSTELHIGALKGPTGIGMAYLFDMKEQGYDVQLFDSPDQVTAKVVSGELDCAAVPSNMGALLYNKTEGGIYCLGINTGSTLYIVGKNAETVTDIKALEGKTIYSAGQGGVPEYVLSALLDSAGVEANVEFLSSHADVVSKILSTEGEAIGLLPEPNVTVIKAKANESSQEVTTLVDLGALWEENYNSTLPMGILIANKSAYEAHTEDMEILEKACIASTNKVLADTDASSELIAELGIVPSAGIAKSVIPSCSIMFKGEPDEEKTILEDFYNILYNYNKTAVGGKLPGEEYYK